MIVVVPALKAVTAPVVASTDATAGLLLLHDPPASPSLLYVAVEPIQSGEVPLTVPAFAFGFTVSEADALNGALHPAVTVYVIVVVPALKAVTAPVEASTDATAGSLLDHTPPDGAIRLTLVPRHADEGPEIEGSGTTFIVVVAELAVFGVAHVAPLVINAYIISPFAGV